MIRNYFEYNGNKYYSGTGLYVKPIQLQPSWVDKQKVTFLGYNDEARLFAVLTEDMKTYWYPDAKFNNIFIGLSGENNYKHQNWVQEKNGMLNSKATFSDELNIDGMLIAWMWYIFIMLVSIIFKECIGVWIFASVVFFNYRKKKLKERGYK